MPTIRSAFRDGGLDIQPEAVGVPDLQLRLPGKAPVAAFGVAGPVHPAHDGPLPGRQPVWFVLDELASLNKLPQLHTAVTETASMGTRWCWASRAAASWKSATARTPRPCSRSPRPKVFFRTSEPRAAKWISDAIGEIEVERLKGSRSMGLLRAKKSYAMEIATKPLVMASEIAGLDSHRAYIKQENRVVPVRFRLAKKRKKQPEFIERKTETSAPRKTAEVPAPAQAAPQKPVQAVPPLDEAPAVRREGFVWDASREIEVTRMYGPPRGCKGQAWPRRQVCANVFGLRLESNFPGHDEMRACLSL